MHTASGDHFFKITHNGNLACRIQHTRKHNMRILLHASQAAKQDCQVVIICVENADIPVLCLYLTFNREGRGAMVWAWRFVITTARRAGSIPSWDIFWEKCNVSPHSTLGHYFNVCLPWARLFTLTCFTWLRCKWVTGSTAMTMCTICSMRRNGCRTVCSTWSLNSTRMSMSSDQRVNCNDGWWIFRFDIRTWICTFTF